MKDRYLDFDEYIVASEPHKREKTEIWKMADRRGAPSAQPTTIVEPSPKHGDL